MSLHTDTHLFGFSVSLHNFVRFVAPAFLSLVLSGCGGVDCEDLSKKATEAGEKYVACFGGDTGSLTKCACEFYPEIIKLGNEQIDGECWPDGYTDEQKKATKDAVAKQEEDLKGLTCTMEA